MKNSNTTRVVISLLSLGIAGAVAAQAPTDFPAKRTKPATCEDFNWNAEMTREHPHVIDACQETVEAEGTYWARLAARFVRVEDDGMVVFSIRNKQDRVIEEVSMQPAPNQVAYIDDRATEFEDLAATDTINLYVADGEYGYSTRPVVTQRFTRRAMTTESTDSTQSMESATPEAYAQIEAPPSREVAMNHPEPMPTRLPQTAGLLPWAAFGGSLFLIGGLVLSLRRKL